MGYNVFLARAYDRGDFGQVYPIARGSAPLIVALVGLMALGDQPSLTGYGGVALLTGGIWWMAGRTGLPRAGLASALVTSVFIASYTLVTDWERVPTMMPSVMCSGFSRSTASAWGFCYGPCVVAGR